MGRHHLYPRSHFLDIQLANGNGFVSHSQQFPPAISPLRLTPRDDSTRVQLQKQVLKEQHATAIVSKTIPGFKTSAGEQEETFWKVTRSIPLGSDFCGAAQLSLRLCVQICVCTLHRRRVLCPRPRLCVDPLHRYLHHLHCLTQSTP